MEVTINISPTNICPYCLGSGKRKAMQMATNRKGQTVMWIDTKSKCKHCDGIGVIT